MVTEYNYNILTKKRMEEAERKSSPETASVAVKGKTPVVKENLTTEQTAEASDIPKLESAPQTSGESSEGTAKKTDAEKIRGRKKKTATE